MKTAIYTDVLQTVGYTPIVEIPTYTTYGRVLVKLEGRNPGGSIKDRPAKHIIETAEAKGLISPYSAGKYLVECSGGSMAHGLLTAAKNRYKCLFVVPSHYSQSKIDLLMARGAEVIKADCKKGNDAHFRLAKEITDKNPDTHYFINQLFNPANPQSHYLYTGPEIIDQLNGERIDYFVTGVGSGGTISGVGKRLKEKYPHLKVIGVQPSGCDVIGGSAIRHRIQGWAVGLKPGTLDTSIIDEMVSVDYWEAIDTCDSVNTRTGHFLGISSGANIFAAKKLAAQVGTGKTILTISADSGVYYADNFNEFRTYVKNLVY